MLCEARRRDGAPCGQPAVKGSNVCHYHGAKSPQAKRKAARRVAEAEAREAARRQLVKRHAPQDPEEEARELVALAKAQVAELSGRLAAHPEELAVLSPALGSWVKLAGDLNAQWARLRTSETTGDAEWANEPRSELLARLARYEKAGEITPEFTAEVIGHLQDAGVSIGGPALPPGESERMAPMRTVTGDAAPPDAVEAERLVAVETPGRPSEPLPPAPHVEVFDGFGIRTVVYRCSCGEEQPWMWNGPCRRCDRPMPKMPAKPITWERLGPFVRPAGDPESGLWPCPACAHESAGGASACVHCGQPRERYEPVQPQPQPQPVESAELA